MESLAGRETGFSRELIDPAILSLLTRIHSYLSRQGVHTCIVGGFIRDVWLGRDVADIDIAISRDASAIAPGLATELEGKSVLLDQANKIVRIVLSGRYPDIDISSFSDTIENDLARRDFSIDAMAVDLAEVTANRPQIHVIDPFGGQDDLDRGVVRTVSETSLSADPVRLLRALRLATELGFHIEHKTEMLIRQFTDLLKAVPGERVRDELMRLLDVSRGGNVLNYLDKLGVLTAVIPELIYTKGVNQPPEHYWDVFTHSITTVTAVDFILGQGVWDYPDDGILTEVPWSPELARYFEKPVASDSNRRTLLKIAALLHDIAKPRTKTLDENGRMRFLGHAEEGQTMVTAVLERLRFSAREITLVANMVKYHLRPTQMGQPPSRRAIYRYFRDTGEAGQDILFLSLADHLATRGPDLVKSNWAQHTEIVRNILEEHSHQDKIIRPKWLVDGNDLINIFGLQPGPELGKLLESFREAQAAGEISSRTAALDYVRSLLLAEGKK